MEDAMILNKSAYERGFGHASVYKNFTVDLGFEAKMISAGVHVEGDQYGPDFDHLAIIVKLEGIEYLVDVGDKIFAVIPPGAQDSIEGKLYLSSQESGIFLTKIEVNGTVQTVRLVKL